MEELIAGATFLKFKLDFKKNVTSLDKNKITLMSSSGETKLVRCYLAKFNPKTGRVIVNKMGDEDFSVLYFPQKSNDNVILVPVIKSNDVDINDITDSILAKWRYES
jgi:hypothetical protein